MYRMFRGSTLKMLAAVKEVRGKHKLRTEWSKKLDLIESKPVCVYE